MNFASKKSEIVAAECLLGAAGMPIYWNVFAALEQARNGGHAEGYHAGFCEGHRCGMNEALQQVREVEELYEEDERYAAAVAEARLSIEGKQPSDRGLDALIQDVDYHGGW